MKYSAEYDRFTALVDRVLAVPHSVIKERVEEHRKQVDSNPSKPGPKRGWKPKRKVKPPASVPDVDPER